MMTFAVGRLVIIATLVVIGIGVIAGCVSQQSVDELHSAALRDDVGGIRKALASGANVDSRDQAGRTPLYLAALQCAEDAARYLIECGAAVNAKASWKGNDTALHVAARDGCVAVAQLLLQNGAQVDIRNSAGQTPLQFASWFDRPQLVQLLIDHGADVNARSKWDATALTHNSEKIRETNAYREVVRKLVEAGADVNASDRLGQTPLSFALSSGDALTAQFLMSAGASGGGSCRDQAPKQ